MGEKNFCLQLWPITVCDPMHKYGMKMNLSADGPILNYHYSAWEKSKITISLPRKPNFVHDQMRCCKHRILLLVCSSATRLRTCCILTLLSYLLKQQRIYVLARVVRTQEDWGGQDLCSQSALGVTLQLGQSFWVVTWDWQQLKQCPPCQVSVFTSENSVNCNLLHGLHD